MKILLLCGLAVLTACFTPSARAVFTIDVAEVGNDVVATGSGSIDTADLTFLNTTPATSGLLSAYQYIAVGVEASEADLYKGVSGSYTLGTQNVEASGGTGTGTGDIVGVDGQTDVLAVPQGYVSGSALLGSFTLYNQSFASLGVTPGTYTYTWGTGIDADSLTVDAVPEPSTWALLAVGTGVLAVGAARRGRRRA